MANNLFVSYDLIAPGQNYETIELAIKALGTAVKVHYSLYYVKATYSPEEAAKQVRAVMDQNDKLIVIEAKDAYWFNNPASNVIQEQWHR